jgi:hypothetical protein
VNYFLFLTWNQTAYSGGEGNQEGDWLCLDFQVTATDPRRPSITHALYHNHGRILLVERSAVELRAGQPVAYLEAGTNRGPIVADAASVGIRAAAFEPRSLGIKAKAFLRAQSRARASRPRADLRHAEQGA